MLGRLSICFFFHYSQLSNLGRCWIAAFPIAFNFHCSRCIPLLEWYIFRSVASLSVFIKAGSGVEWAEQPFQAVCFYTIFVLNAPFSEQLTHESSVVSCFQRNPIEENRPAWMRVRDSSTPFPVDKEILSQVCSQLQRQCSHWCWGKLGLPNQLPWWDIQEKAESRVSKKLWLLAFLKKQMRRALLTWLLFFTYNCRMWWCCAPRSLSLHCHCVAIWI